MARIGKRRGAIVPVFAAMSLGILAGLGIFTFGYARGASYLTDDPAACANCHVMQEQYSGWRKSTHGRVAVCNDCHTPPGLISKYAAKARNGFLHSLAFTTGRFPDRIVINPRNFEVAEGACLKCHSGLVDRIRAARPHGAGVACVSCHPGAGHL
ncbi:MAG: cytochrome c nitrite reductase small subunit [Bryobacteraceae bacterium]